IAARTVAGDKLFFFTPSSVVPAGSMVRELMASVSPPDSAMVFTIAPFAGLITHMFWLVGSGTTKSCWGVDTSGKKDRPSPVRGPAAAIAPRNVARPDILSIE